MKIQLMRVYEIEFDGTSAQFIELVDRELKMRHDTQLDSLDMGDAVEEATQLFDQGDLTHLVDIVANEYNYIDCPDKDTLLWYFPEADTYQPTRPGAKYSPTERTQGWCLDCGEIERRGIIRHPNTCPSKTTKIGD
jgi:hypothetical protein